MEVVIPKHANAKDKELIVEFVNQMLANTECAVLRSTRNKLTMVS